MLANYLIGLREGLEATLVVSILVAYLVKTDRRRLLPRVWLGVGLAVALSVALTLGLGLQSRQLTFRTQELIGATGRDLPDSAPVTSTPLVAAVLGIATAVVLGHLVYRGALSINLGRFFAWTGALLVLVAAGVLSYGVHARPAARLGRGHPAQGLPQLLARHDLGRGPGLVGVRRRRAPALHHTDPPPAVPDPSPRTRRNPRMKRTVLALCGATALVATLGACGTESIAPTDSSGAAGDARALTVDSSADACTLSADKAPAGALTFDVTNSGSQVTEFYLLDEDGLRIVAEVENIGPSITRALTVNAPAGTYVTACKPGMTGEGIRGELTVTDSGEAVQVSADEQELVDQAEANYAAYVEDQSAQLLEKTREFVDVYTAGDDDAARALYPVARTHWERIETVAESFGDLDPMMDAREADLEPGQKWTGWHLIEKDLWPQRAEGYAALTDRERTTYADDLLANTVELDSRVQELTFAVDAIANGSRGLLEEVAKGKVTGEEEYWSRTDLWDFQANIDGARVGFEGVQPIVEEKDPELADQLTTRFEELQVLLDAQREGDGFVSYDDLTPEQVKELSDSVNALSEPLSRLTAAVLS